MTITALAADDPAPPSFMERLAELLPSHTFYEDRDTVLTATWSSPGGIWNLTVAPVAYGCKTRLTGPNTRMEFAHIDLGLIAKSLSIAGAVSLVVLDGDMVLDEQNGNVRQLSFGPVIGGGVPPSLGE